VPLELGPDGRFGIAPGDVWWERDDHFPFFIRAEGKLVGFALARRGSPVTGEPDVMDVAEFFVVRGARGKGVGAEAARALFGAFPGPWALRVRSSNFPALKFWSRVVEDWSGHPVGSTPFTADGVEWEGFRVEAK
jgi:predicted acetyltransferase